MTKKDFSAQKAADKALADLESAIISKKNFCFEAGAGAGKTFALVHALNFIIKKYSEDLSKKGAQIACISYTNVAKEQIEERTEEHPLILSSTIHSFCWQLIHGFQQQMREFVGASKNWEKSLKDIKIDSQQVEYDKGYRYADDEKITLHHNDIIPITTKLLESKKFRSILTSNFPILFIDEYQDTDKEMVKALSTHFLNSSDSKLQIGLFGDHWQKIYDSGCGEIQSESITLIKSEANFRSDKVIVDALNGLRPDHIQYPRKTERAGDIKVFHTNSYPSEGRKIGSHYKGDLDDDSAKLELDNTIKHLEKSGWNFSPDETKVLMLTHTSLAKEQGYLNIKNTFRSTDEYIQKDNMYIRFLTEVVEELCLSFAKKENWKCSEIIEQNSRTNYMGSEKTKWLTFLKELMPLRQSGTIGEILEYIKKAERLQIPDKIIEHQLKLKKDGEDGDYFEELSNINFKEITALHKYIENETPFSTKHGVKGNEFDNVLMVLGRGWSRYNWDEYLSFFQTKEIPKDKLGAYERNRNLFYVCCSRAKKRLALLFTQELSAESLLALESIFGENIWDVQNMPDIKEA